MVAKSIKIKKLRINFEENFKEIHELINELLNSSDFKPSKSFLEKLNYYIFLLKYIRRTSSEINLLNPSTEGLENINLVLSTIKCFIIDLNEYKNNKTVSNLIKKLTEIQKQLGNVNQENTGEEHHIKILSIKEL